MDKIKPQEIMSLRQKKDTKKTSGLSKLDSPLPKLLSLASQVTHTDLSAEEIKFWTELFWTCRADILEWAFNEYLRTGIYFPKPADIQKLYDSYLKQEQDAKRPRFRACGKGDCQDGWRRVYEGRTAGGNVVDPKYGAVVRCECFLEWKASLVTN